MTHIKIKHNYEAALNEGVKKVIETTTSPAPINMEQLFENSEEYEVICTTTDGRIVTGFSFPSQNKPKLIFEPNPIITYYAIAHNYANSAIKLREKLLLEDIFLDMIVDSQLHKTFHFLTSASICTTFMFTSLEIMLNIIIEKNTTPLIFENETRSSEFILRKVPFEDKVKVILPQIHKLNFHSECGHKYAHIKKLKQLRDSTMHFKPVNERVAGLRPFITANLKFDFLETLQAVRDYIDFYFKGLIENCNCGKD